MRILLPRTSKREKNLTMFTFFVMALCYVQKCELSYNVLDMTQNCIPPSDFIIPNRECMIRLGIGEDANVMFKQVSHRLVSRLLHFCNWSVLLWTVLHCVTYCELCIVFRWPSLASGFGFTLPQSAQIDLSSVDVPLNTKQRNKVSYCGRRLLSYNDCAYSCKWME